MDLPTLFLLLAKISNFCLRFYGWLIVAAILLTWIQPDPSNRWMRWLRRLTSPFINWVGEWLPRILLPFSAYIALLMVWNLAEVFGEILINVGSFASGRLPAAALGVRLAGFGLTWLVLMLRSFLSFLILLMVIWFVITLVKPSLHNPIVRTIGMLVDPFISPIQRRFPGWCWVGSVDISPLLVLLIVWLLISWPISWLFQLAFILTH